MIAYLLGGLLLAKPASPALHRPLHVVVSADFYKIGRGSKKTQFDVSALLDKSGIKSGFVPDPKIQGTGETLVFSLSDANRSIVVLRHAHIKGFTVYTKPAIVRGK